MLAVIIVQRRWWRLGVDATFTLCGGSLSIHHAAGYSNPIDPGRIAHQSPG